MSLARLGALGALLLAALGCTGLGGPAGPEAAAISLFELAGSEPEPDRIDATFGPVDDELSRARLLDALEQLPPTDEPQVVEVVPRADSGPVIVDLAVMLDSGGEATFSVKLDRDADGPWRIAWFQGPGIEWPRSARRKDNGLSTRPELAR